MHELQCGLCMANQHSNVHTVHAKQNINMYIYQRLSERQMDSKINISRQWPQWLSTIDYICFYSFSVFIRFVFARTLTYVQYVAIRMHQQLIGVRTYSIQPDSHYWVWSDSALVLSHTISAPVYTQVAELHALNSILWKWHNLHIRGYVAIHLINTVLVCTCIYTHADLVGDQCCQM